MEANLRRPLADAVHEHLSRLPEPQQQAFALMVLHGQPVTRIASETGASPEALREAVTLAMKSVRAGLDEAGLSVEALLRQGRPPRLR